MAGDGVGGMGGNERNRVYTMCMDWDYKCECLSQMVSQGTNRGIPKNCKRIPMKKRRMDSSTKMGDENEYNAFMHTRYSRILG